MIVRVCHPLQRVLQCLSSPEPIQLVLWVSPCSAEESMPRGADGRNVAFKPKGPITEAPPPRSLPIPWAAIALVVLLGPLVLSGWRDAARQQLPAKIAAV